MLIKFFKLQLLLFVLHSYGYAQGSQYQFSHLDINNGLSHNQVNCIHKDAQGFMWFGTMMGLNRYDGYSFKVFKHDPQNPRSITDNYISNIYDGPGNKLWIDTHKGLSIYDPETEQFISMQAQLNALHLPNTEYLKINRDRKGGYWFVTLGLGVYNYNPLNGHTTHYARHANNTLALFCDSVRDVAQDKQGNMVFVYSTGVIEKLNTRNNKIIYHSTLLSNANFNKTQYYDIKIDADNDIWLYSNNCAQGVFYLNDRTNTLQHFDKESKGFRLNSNIVNSIVQDDEGLIWIATDHGGIDIINKKKSTIQYLLNREDDLKSLRQNSVMLYKDNLGIIWAGTFKEGISYYHKSIITFPVFRHFASDPKSLSNEDVDKFAEDKNGNLWIGTNGGGLIYYNRKTGVYTSYKHNPNNANTLSNDIIVSLCIDHNQKLWIGTYFGGLDFFDGAKFTHYRHSDKDPHSLADDRVWSIIEDSKNRLWVGTFSGGINIFNEQTKTFTHPFDFSKIPSPYISALVNDKNGNVWIGGYLGADCYNMATGKVEQYLHSKTDNNSLVSDNVNSILNDSRGLTWIGTRDGLSILNQQTQKFINLHKSDGLPDDVIMNVLEDNDHTIWLSTSSGLCNIRINNINGHYKFGFKNYDEHDGLQSREFNANAALKTSKGEIIFGGPHGFNLFNPAHIVELKEKPKLVFTGFNLFNKSIEASELINGHAVLTRSITDTKSIELHHNENMFTIEFSALNMFDPHKVKYQYIMEGFDKNWIPADIDTRKATYTNLDAGNYVFKLRALNEANLSSSPNTIVLNIVVRPPFWKTRLAYAFYITTFFGLLLYIRHRGILKLKNEFIARQEKLEVERLLEQERSEVKRMQELDLMKIKFLTNVSHEFRTPISLIMAPVDTMLKNGAADSEGSKQLKTIKTNARRLLNLVNQLLDFRKMEVKELKLHTQQGNFIRFIEEVVSSFNDLADKKAIHFLFDTEIDSLDTSFDHDKIERILFNLLSNAFKFTPQGGHVSVLVNTLQEKSSEFLKLIEIKIIDTGIGIPKEFHEKVFDRFFQHQIPGSLLNQGSGIGLSITREFVNMHNGEIFIESEPDQGTCIIIQLPLVTNHHSYSNSLMADSDLVLNHEPGVEAVAKFEPQSLSVGLTKSKKPTLLIVEDNDDFRFYLKDNLKSKFNLIEAANGKEGWQKALSLHPDIIVSDISMPEMNGIDLCKKLKADERTLHIPVILLTALTGEEDQLKGLQIGANDYMTKPFNFEILLSKISNLLILQERFKKTYTKQMHVQIEDIVVDSTEEKFLCNCVDYIQKNLLNPALSVEELSRQMNMSRVSLYKKMLALTGKTPVEFIRSIRLQKAAQLLEKSQLNVTGVCYEIGLNNPTYFTKIFKEEFNMLPSEYAITLRKKK
jgi:signal transduction histidine kinase/ligand-binding sensor domain-containing protein/DNA-binding response OmpR family regulator